jgi:hypothetical protein
LMKAGHLIVQFLNRMPMKWTTFEADHNRIAIIP